MGSWRPDHPPHLHLRPEHWAHMLRSRRRDPIHQAASQSCDPRPHRLQLGFDHYQCDSPANAQPRSLELEGQAVLLFLGFSAVCFIWCYLRLPETFGLSYLEIDILFEKKAKTSNFRGLQQRLAHSG